MPVFEYRGLNKEGRNVKGSVDADNQRAARIRLKRDGVFVVDLKDKSKATRKSKGKNSALKASVGVQELSLMTRQLATLLKANIPLVDSLAAVAEQVENQALQDAMMEIKNNVNEGGQLFKSLAKYPKIFDKIYVSMVEAGEMSGTLDVILIRLAEFTESQSELRAKVSSALMYPILMFGFMSLLLVGLFTFVIPGIMEIFESTPEITLPWYSQVVMSISNTLTTYWYVAVSFVLISVFLFRTWKNSTSGAFAWDGIKLNIPKVGKLLRMIAVSRFARTLSTLLTGGVPMLTAMSIVRNVVSNEVLAKAIDLARDNISEGESIAGPLKKSGQFPPLVLHMINIGEKTGELENLLTQVSDSYDFQVKNEVEGITSILGPFMIIVMGIVIGIIVFAVMMPILELQKLGG